MDEHKGFLEEIITSFDEQLHETLYLRSELERLSKYTAFKHTCGERIHTISVDLDKVVESGECQDYNFGLDDGDEEETIIFWPKNLGDTLELDAAAASGILLAVSTEVYAPYQGLIGARISDYSNHLFGSPDIITWECKGGYNAIFTARVQNQHFVDVSLDFIDNQDIYKEKVFLQS